MTATSHFIILVSLLTSSWAWFQDRKRTNPKGRSRASLQQSASRCATHGQAHFSRHLPCLRNHLRVIAGHQLSKLLLTGRSRCLIELAHFLKVAQIALRRKGTEETSGPLRWIAERMSDPSRHHHECSLTDPNCFRSHHKLQFAFEDVKALFMRMGHDKSAPTDAPGFSEWAA